VQPLATRRTGLAAGDGDEGAPDPSTADTGSDHLVLDPGVYEAVPDDVHETDEAVSESRRHPAETVTLHEGRPVVIEGPVPERIGV